jgi:DNA-directed RNA polymerase sigma subunit (sigma70/sigma32)
MSKPHGTRRLANGRYLAWSGDEKSEHATQDAAESWVRRRKHDAHRLDADQYQMSFDRIGKSLGISTVRVRQLELQAISKLREALLDDPEFRFWSDLTR